MSRGMKRMVLVVLVVAAAFSVIGTAAAQGPGGRRGGAAMGEPMLGERWFGARIQLRAYLLDGVMEATALSLVEVQAALRDGQSLTDILEANGVDPQAVTESVTAAVTAEIDAQVASGDLTEARAATLKEQLPDALDHLLTATRPQAGGVRGWLEERGEALRGRMMERGYGMGGGQGMMGDCPCLDDSTLDS